MSTVVILILLGLLAIIQAELCQRPQVQSKFVYIYRLKDTKAITVYNCFHIKSPTIAYSDITDRCLKSLKLGFFVDKFNNTNNLVQRRSSKGYVTSYFTKGDRVENKVFLKSGTVCRYDRGFCYDPKENNNYAAVWNIDVTPGGAATGELIYQGIVDIWSFKNNTLNYLFRETKNKNEAFSLQLLKPRKMNNIGFWFTDKKFIVADGPLLGLKTAPVHMKELLMGTKSQVSEAILKSCDIQSLEFTKSILPISEDYFTNPDNLKTILRTYGETISTINQQAMETQASNIEKKLDNYVKNLQIILQEKDRTIEALKTTIVKLNNTLTYYIKILNESQNNSTNIDIKVLYELKHKMNDEYNELSNKIDKQDIINSQVSEKLNKLDKSLFDVNNKNLKTMEILSELQSQHKIDNNKKQETDSSRKAIEAITNKLDSWPEKYSLIMKLIEENKNANMDVNKKLERLYKNIFDKDDNASLYSNYKVLDKKFDNKIKDIQNLFENFELTYSNELQQQLKADRDKDIEKYNLQMTRLYDNEKLSSNMKKEIDSINKIFQNIQEENEKFNDSLLNVRTEISDFQMKYNTDLKNLLNINNKTLNEINKDINEKYKELLAFIETMKLSNEKYEVEQLEKLKNLSLSLYQNNEQIKTILHDIKNVDVISESVTQNAMNIEKLLLDFNSEKDNLKKLNSTIQNLLKDGKDVNVILNEMHKVQEGTRYTIHDYDSKIINLRSELNEVIRNITDSKDVLLSAKKECSECSTAKFKVLNVTLEKIKESLIQKDENINECRENIKVLSNKHEEEMTKLSRKHDEEIEKLREEIKNLRDEILGTFIPPN